MVVDSAGFRVHVGVDGRRRAHHEALPVVGLIPLRPLRHTGARVGRDLVHDGAWRPQLGVQADEQRVHPSLQLAGAVVGGQHGGEAAKSRELA